MIIKRSLEHLILLAIVVLLIILPSITFQDYPQPTVVSKFVVFSFGCLIILCGFSTRFIFSELKTIRISKLDIALLLLIFYITINRYISQSNYGFSIRYMELLGLGVIYIVLRTFSIKAYLWIFLAIVISGIVQAIYGNLQLLGYYPSNHSGFNITGSFFNPGPYAGFIAVVYSISLGMNLFKDNIIQQIYTSIKITSKYLRISIKFIFEYIPLTGVICTMLVIPATRSRAAWLAVLLSSLIIIEYRYGFVKKLFKKIKGVKKTIAIAVILLIFFAGLLGIYHFKKGSSDGRLFIWKVTTGIVKDFPITGIGFDRFKAHYMDYQANYFKQNGETSEALVADNTYYAFNEWLQFAAENGIIGILLLVLLLYAIYNIKTKQEHIHLSILIKGGILAIGIFALFSYPMQILPIKLVLAVILAISANIDLDRFSLFKIKDNTKPYTKWSYKIIVLAFGAFIITKGILYAKTLDQAYKGWKGALNIYQYGDYQDSTEEYSKVYPSLSKEGDFLMNYGKALAMAGQNKKAIQVLEEAKHYINSTIIETALGDANKAIKNYDKAEKAYQHAANMIPIRFYPLYLQAKLFTEAGEKEKANDMARTILKKEIKIPSTAIKEIQSEMKKIIKKPLLDKK